MSGRFLNQSRRLQRKSYKGRYLLHPPLKVNFSSRYSMVKEIRWNLEKTPFTTKSPRTRGRKELIIFSFHLHVPYLPIGLTCCHLGHLRWLGFERSRRCSNNTCESLWRADCEGCLSLGRPTSRCLERSGFCVLTQVDTGLFGTLGTRLQKGQ